MFAVGVILTAVDLAGVVQEIRSARPHFAEEPHITPAEELPKTGEVPKTGEIPQEPQKATQFVNEHPETIVEAKPGQRRAELGKHEVVEVTDAHGIHCEFHSPGGPSIPCPTGWGEAEGAAAAASQVSFDQATIDDLIKNLWEVEKANHPEKAHIYDSYINNLRERKAIRSWEQSEKEVQYLYGSREQRVRTPEGLTKPDFAPATGWHGEVKNWNILYPTEEEIAAGARGALPKKLQGLVDQVKRRRLAVGESQTVVIDIRGQLSVHGVDPAKAAANQSTINSFTQVVADATGLPREQIQVLTW
jgi:hypothetical protein